MHAGGRGPRTKGARGVAEALSQLKPHRSRLPRTCTCSSLNPSQPYHNHTTPQHNHIHTTPRVHRQMSFARTRRTPRRAPSTTWTPRSSCRWGRGRWGVGGVSNVASPWASARGAGPAPGGGRRAGGGQGVSRRGTGVGCVRRLHGGRICMRRRLVCNGRACACGSTAPPVA